jgi:hypothetical protein
MDDEVWVVPDPGAQGKKEYQARTSHEQTETTDKRHTQPRQPSLHNGKGIDDRVILQKEMGVGQ